MTDLARVSAARWREGSWGRIAHGVGVALAYQAAMVVPLVALAPLWLGEQDPFEAPPAAFLLLAVIVFLQAGLVIGFCLLRWGRVSLRDLGWTLEGGARDVARGLIGFAVVAAIVMGSRAATGGGAAVSEAWQAVVGYSLAQRALFLLVGFIAAFGEETIFRGYLQPSFIERWGKAGGVLATAAFFSVYHLQFAPHRLLGLLLIGLTYGVLRGHHRSLVAPAVAHGLCWAVLGAL